MTIIGCLLIIFAFQLTLQRHLTTIEYLPLPFSVRQIGTMIFKLNPANQLNRQDQIKHPERQQQIQ